jgi:hypothetical protein
MLGPLISSIHARPNAGATKGDMARANRINLLTGLFGGLATAYGARQDANAQAEANKGLFDIIAKGGGERATEAAGPVMPGMAQPTAMTKIPMSAAFAELGASNPRLQDSALKLALAAQGNEHQDLWAQKRMDLEQSRYNTEQDWRQQTFGAEQAHRNAMLGLHRDQLNFQKQESEALRPYKQLANERNAYGDDIANELLRSRLAAGVGATQAPTTTQSQVSATPGASMPTAATGQPTGTNILALMDSVADKKTAAASVERLDKITNDPALRSATEDYRKGRLALESVAELVNTGEIQSMDRQMLAKRLVQSIEPGIAVNAGEAENALTRMGTAGVYVKNWIDDVFADGTRVGPAQVKRALEQLAINVDAQRRSALDMLENKRQYGAGTGVIQQHLPLIGAGFVDGGDPRQLAGDAWKIFSTKGQPGTGSGLTGRAAELEMERSAILAKRGWR